MDYYVLLQSHIEEAESAGLSCMLLIPANVEEMVRPLPKWETRVWRECQGRIHAIERATSFADFMDESLEYATNMVAILGDGTQGSAGIQAGRVCSGRSGSSQTVHLVVVIICSCSFCWRGHGRLRLSGCMTATTRVSRWSSTRCWTWSHAATWKMCMPSRGSSMKRSCRFKKERLVQVTQTIQ